MKRVSRILPLLLVVVLLALSVAACGKKASEETPLKDFKTLYQTYKSRGYTVEAGDEMGQEEEDTGAFASVYAQKNTAAGKELAQVVYYKTEEAAQKALEDSQALFELSVKGTKEYASELKYGRDRTIVYFGTEDSLAVIWEEAE